MNFNKFEQSGYLQLIERVIFPFNTLSDEIITIDDYYNNLYIPHSYKSFKPYESQEINEYYDITKVKGKTIITGVMGAGKSTFLLWLYKQQKEIYTKNKLQKQPIIFNLTDIITNDDFKKDLLSKKDDVILFVDSIDETILNFDSIEIKNSINFLVEFDNIYIACRTPFYYDFFDINMRIGLDLLIQLESLSNTKQEFLLDKYLNSLYLVKRLKNNNAKEISINIINRCKGDKTTENTIVSTPLFTGITAIVASTTNVLHKMNGIIDVYSSFVLDFSKRKFGDESYVNNLSSLAFDLYRSNIKEDIIYFDELKEQYNLNSTKSIQDFIQLRKNKNDNREMLIDFRHRSIGEFLIAKYIVNQMTKSSFTFENITNLFERLYNYEICFFIRSLLKDLKLGIRTKIFEEFKRYIEYKITSKSQSEIIAVHNCLYFFTFSNKEGVLFAEKIANFFHKSELNIHPLISGTFFSGLISYGLLELHIKIMHDSSNVGFDIIWNRNLNYHLFYYGDSDFKNPDDFIKEINAETRWDNSRNILLNRIPQVDSKRLLFKRFDITSLRMFLEKTEINLNSVELEKLRDIINTSNEWVEKIENIENKKIIIDEIKKISSIIGFESTKEMKPLKKTQNKFDIFVSYSKHDNDYLIEFEKHCITLIDIGLIQTFNCSKIDVGDDWDSIIKTNITNCDIMICLVSANFLNTKYIQEIEIPQAIKLGKTIIPIIIKSCNWSDSPLSKYQASLKGKIISIDNQKLLEGKIKKLSTEERDVIWTQVIEELKKLLLKI